MFVYMDAILTRAYQDHVSFSESISTAKVMLITSVALAALGSAIWSSLRNMPKVAGACVLGGFCIEAALLLLVPNRSETIRVRPSGEKPSENSASITALIVNLERCYPVKAVDPVALQDQQAGGMMGEACGDAIGLFTEFTTKKEAEEMIDGKPINFGKTWPDKFVNGHNWGHIKRFVKNGWTDDTDQALSLLRALYLHIKGGEDDPSFPILFATELKKWRNGGLRTESPFIGRENPYCMGLGALVSAVLQHRDFLKDPHAAAEEVWAKNRDQPLQNRPAANGAIMRTAPIGLIFYQSFADVIEYTRAACKVTHADPRCTASCVALTIAIAMRLRGYEAQEMIGQAEEAALAVLKDELSLAAKQKLLPESECEDLDALFDRTADELKAHLHGNWTTLDLDEGWNDKTKMNKIGYTFKCLGAAFYALKLAEKYQNAGSADIFRKIIEEIALEGGDADTNGAAAGALIGAYLGYRNQFPQNWSEELADQPVMKQAIAHIQELSE